MKKNNLKILTIVLIVVLIVLTILTFCILTKNFGLIKETFLGSNHNCYPYTAVLNARLSHLSPSKGWCTTGDYPELQTDEADSDSQKSSACDGSGDYYRIKGEESVKLNSKAWCKSTN